MLTVDVKAENAWNKFVAFKPGKDSVFKVRSPKSVLYEESSNRSRRTVQAKNTQNISESFWVLVLKLNAVFHEIKFCLQKCYIISALFVLGERASVNILTSTDLTYWWINLACLKELLVNYLWVSFFVVWGNPIFSVGNSRLNCQIIKSIFDTSLVYLHYACSPMSFMAVHITKNSLLRISLSPIFVLLPRKFATSNFAISNFRGKSWIFRLKLYETSFENSMTFRGKFAGTKDEFRRNSFALLLHNTVHLN